MRARSVAAASAMALCIASCTSLLGDFEVRATDTGPDVTSGDDASEAGDVIIVVSGDADASDAVDASDAETEAPPGPPAPQPLWPMSTAFSTSRRPTFKWKLRPGEDGARVEVCRDRACTLPVTSFAVTGSQGTPSADLPQGIVFWRLRGKSGSQLGSDHSSVWELVIPPSTAPVATAWGSVLDVNGDGFGDLAVGALDAPVVDGGYGNGSVYLYFGGSNRVDPKQTPVMMQGPEPANFGRTVASAGDVNGDGYGDLLVQADGVNNYSGRVYLFLGGPNGPSTTPAVTFANPDGGPQENFGMSLSSLGDANGDGYGDVVIASTKGAYLYYGGPSGPSPMPSSTWSQPSGWYMGGVANAGDVNGDGYEDLAIGMLDPNNKLNDTVKLYPGSAQGPAPMAALSIANPDTNTSTTTSFGDAVSAAGDVNGDGFADLLVGDAGISGAYVFAGSAQGLTPTPATTLKPSGSQSQYGFYLQTAGNFLGDAYSGVLIGSTGSGPIDVWAGSQTGIVSSAPKETLTGNPFSAYCIPYAITSGDLDGDGMSEIAYVGETNAGDTAVIIQTTGVSTIVLNNPGSAGDEFGQSVAAR